MPNLVGKSLGKYHIVERLGRGGMAEVYKAYHAKLDRYVTVKILHSYLVDGPDFLPRFDREARAVASLRNPHIVQIHDYEVEDENYYMVVEYIDGGNLQVRLDELARAGAYMPIRQVLSILGQVADALDYAHRQGIIHRDIKPSNILLDSKGNAFLSDFGIARIVGGSQVTTTGSLIGTPAYMSPEQALGQDLSDASDIYSLGVVVYELLTGKAPFVADTPLAIIHQQVNEPPSPAKLLRPDLPDAVSRVIARALAKVPAERYQTASDLLHDLERALPKDAITTLDAGSAPGSTPIAAAPTIRMEEAEQLTPASLQQHKASTGKPPAAPASAQAVASDKRPDVPEKHAERPVPAMPAAMPSPERPAGTKAPIRTIGLAVAGIVVVAVAAFLVLNARGPASLPAVSAPTSAASPTPYVWQQQPAGTISPTSTPIQGALYAVDFEDGYPKGWEFDSGWKIAPDGTNHVLLGQGHYWAYSNKPISYDYQLTFRLKLLRGRIHLVTHLNDVGRYYIGFEADHSDLTKQLWPSTFTGGLAYKHAAHNAGVWHDVVIQGSGSTLTFFVDGKQEWTYTDPKPLTGGSFAFETQSAAQAQIDDIVLVPLSAAR